MSERAQQTVLVTGANSGIGLATVLAAARAGFRAVGTVRTDEKAAVVHDAADAERLPVETVLLDVTDDERCAAVVEEVGPVHGLVNNAGYGMLGAVEDVPDDEVRTVLETMVVAPMRLARLVVPGMRDIGGGRIVNVSSVYGRATTPLTGWYQASKHALEAVSDALRMEVARDGIDVVLVEPGGFKTNIWDDLERDLEKRAGSAYEASYKRSGQLMGLSSAIMGEPEQCAKVIVGALTARSPRPRYLVGVDAALITATQRFTPTAVRDRLIRMAQGL